MRYRERLRVLVVDDEPSICKALTIALERAGYDAAAAQSGDAAMSKLQEEHFDALLIDFRIPDLRGDVIFELAASVQPHLRECTVFMTGDITERAQRLIEACHCPLVRKPFDLGDVVEAIAAVLPRSFRRDASA
jgi:DNA-binding NtrC family response regulator